MLDALSAEQVAEWQARTAALANSSAASLPRDRPVDLLGEFAKPWCLTLAMHVTGANAHERGRLSELGSKVYAGTGQPAGSPLKTAAAEAVAELQQMFESRIAQMGEPTLVGVSQTMPRLLANGWLALAMHPGEWMRLREDPELMPRAIEEMMRYASIVPALFRRAVEDVEVGAVRIASGMRVHLMIGSANRDAEQFADPNRLDVGRRAAGHLTLGTGRNSCVGAMLIRMSASMLTAALVRRIVDPEVAGPVEWRTGSGFCWPAEVWVKDRSAASS